MIEEESFQCVFVSTIMFTALSFELYYLKPDSEKGQNNCLSFHKLMISKISKYGILRQIGSLKL